MNTWHLGLQFSKLTMQAEPYMSIINITLNYLKTESRFFYGKLIQFVLNVNNSKSSPKQHRCGQISRKK